MPHKHLNDISVFQWIITTIVALWAVLSAFLKRHFEPETKWTTKLYFFIQDFVISGGTTYLVFMALVGEGFSDTIAIPVAGFIGHKATRFSYLIELAIQEKLGLKHLSNKKENNG